MKIKVILTTWATKSDAYGNRYFVGRATNPRTGKCITVKTSSRGNLECVACRLLDTYTPYSIEVCTGSARFCSLPDAERMDIAGFARALRGIGYSVPESRVKDYQGCL